MNIRAIRGAICLTEDSVEQMISAVPDLLTQMFNRNGLSSEDLISVLLTCTPDLVSGFPATAARSLGWKDVPLMCAVEMNVSGSLPKVVRAMMHVHSSVPRSGINHVYLRGAEALRLDIAQ